MLDILFAILEMIAEVFFEAAFEFIIEFLGSLVLRGIEAMFDTSQPKNPLLVCMGYVFLGGVVGGLSLLLFPHPMVHRSRIPGVSLIISPVLAGLGMSFVGASRRRRDQKVIQIESFGYGFAFAFGMALIRFLFTTKV